jgi:branched-chain amino acid transport system ATP-binding protein
MSALLECKGVSRAFGGLMAVNNVSLHVERGEIVGLIGPNGAGKTTLFNVVSGAIRPTNGQILFDGQIISGRRPDEICGLGLARTFQLAKPFGQLTVLQNVMVGAFKRTARRAEAEQVAWRVCHQIGLEHKAHLRPSSLTTSDRKRLEIARGLATAPRMLLLDEVMSGLTPTESQHLVSLIRQIRDQGVTLLVIEHVMQAIMSLSDRIAVLNYGELIAQGPPHEIAQNEAVIDAYLGEEFLLAEGNRS